MEKTNRQASEHATRAWSVEGEKCDHALSPRAAMKTPWALETSKSSHAVGSDSSSTGGKRRAWVSMEGFLSVSHWRGAHERGTEGHERRQVSVARGRARARAVRTGASVSRPSTSETAAWPCGAA